MFKNTVFFVVLCLQSALGFAAGELPVAAQLKKGIPLLVVTGCSAAAVKSSLWEQPLAFSAGHCFMKFGGVEDGAKLRGTHTAHSSGNIMGVGGFGNAFKFDLAQGDFSGVHDFVVAPIVSKIKGVKVLELTPKTPQAGDKVTAWGYAGKGIPLLVTGFLLTKLECTFKGYAMMSQSANLKGYPWTVLGFAECPPQVFIAGMSGGPVVNGQGQYIGMLNNGATLKFKSERSEKTYLFFQVLSEEEVRLRMRESKSSYIYVPAVDGRRHYQPLYKVWGTYVGERSQKAEWNLDKLNAVIPFDHGFIDGIVEDLTPSGEVWERSSWEHGQFKELLSVAP